MSRLAEMVVLSPSRLTRVVAEGPAAGWSATLDEAVTALRARVTPRARAGSSATHL